VVNGQRSAAITTNGSGAATSVHPAGIEKQLPALVAKVDPVLAPVLPADDEPEVPAGQRVERAGHTGAPVPIMRIGCS
jgi:hypothetical protein